MACYGCRSRHGLSRPAVSLSFGNPSNDCQRAPLGGRRKSGEKNRALGISHGGRSAKIRARVHRNGRLLTVVLSEGRPPRNQAVETLFDAPRPPVAAIADAAHDIWKLHHQPQKRHTQSLLSKAVVLA